MSKEELQSLLAKWQPILRLQDWDIDIMFVKPCELDPNTGGEVIRMDPKKAARIKVLDPDHYDPCLIIKQDVEYTVVHELVHVYFAAIDDFKGTDDTLYEQAIHRIATSLLFLDRRTPALQATA